jgi:type II secretory pathway pseudopilin PulG
MLNRTNVAQRRFPRDEDGFSLIEMIVATGLLAGAVATLGQLFAIAVANNVSSRSGSYATVLAAQKMEQLRGLAWGFDLSGLPVADLTSDTAAAVETPAGGTGLSPSPAGTLTRNTAGYVDYVDRFGRILGGGETIPPRAVFTRRWSVEPLPGSPDSLLLQVLVTTRSTRGAADDPGSARRLPDEARLVGVRSRNAS